MRITYDSFKHIGSKNIEKVSISKIVCEPYQYRDSSQKSQKPDADQNFTSKMTTNQ